MRGGRTARQEREPEGTTVNRTASRHLMGDFGQRERHTSFLTIKSATRRTFTLPHKHARTHACTQARFIITSLLRTTPYPTH